MNLFEILVVCIAAMVIVNFTVLCCIHYNLLHDRYPHKGEPQYDD